MPGEEKDKAAAGPQGGKLKAYRGQRDLGHSGEPSGRSGGRRHPLDYEDFEFADPAGDPERDRPESVKSGKDISQLDGKE